MAKLSDDTNQFLDAIFKGEKIEGIYEDESS